MSGLSKHWKNPRMGVYIDIVTKPEAVAHTSGLLQVETLKKRSGRGLWLRLIGVCPMGLSDVNLAPSNFGSRKANASL